jgi:hypothetical protein
LTALDFLSGRRAVAHQGKGNLKFPYAVFLVKALGGDWQGLEKVSAKQPSLERR